MKKFQFHQTKSSLLDSVPQMCLNLPETNSSPLKNSPSQKETIVFQPSIFRCKPLVSGRVFSFFCHRFFLYPFSFQPFTQPFPSQGPTKSAYLSHVRGAFFGDGRGEQCGLERTKKPRNHQWCFHDKMYLYMFLEQESVVLPRWWFQMTFLFLPLPEEMNQWCFIHDKMYLYICWLKKICCYFVKCQIYWMIWTSCSNWIRKRNDACWYIYVAYWWINLGQHFFGDPKSPSASTKISLPKLI